MKVVYLVSIVLFFEDTVLHTVLIDSLNIIKLIGDPLNNKKLLKTYLDVIGEISPLVRTPTFRESDI